MTEGVPDFIARAMHAQGKVTPEEVMARLDGDLVAEEEERPVVPERRGAQVCADCGGAASVVDKNTLREVVGWARTREQGGQNHVIGRKETGRFMCPTCSTRLRAGLPTAQESLLG